MGMNHQVHSRGYMRNMASVPGTSAKKVANSVSSKRPAMRILFFMPCWKMESRRVLQINTSAHWTMTMAVKNIVWQVYSTILRSEEVGGEESVLHENDQVTDETDKSLNHANLTVCHGDESLVDKLVGELVARVALHDVGLGLLVSKGDGGQEISSQINAKNRHCSQGEWHGQAHEDQKGGDFGDVGGEGVGN